MAPNSHIPLASDRMCLKLGALPQMHDCLVCHPDAVAIRDRGDEAELFSAIADQCAGDAPIPIADSSGADPGESPPVAVEPEQDLPYRAGAEPQGAAVGGATAREARGI
eukprot:5025104-Pyramimonas_sp.AAC.1